MDIAIFTLETSHLLTPFAGLRMRHAASLEQLTQAISEAGQLVPMLVTAGEEAGKWILIDGYRRLEVLRRLEIEQVKAQLLPGNEQDAILLHLAHGQARTWEAIEEAGLIRELHERCGLSMRHIAANIGRNVSWVQRRLALIREMSPEILNGVLAGRLSAWAANRILLPLARANSDHARQLLAILEKEGYSTRELQSWWKHYQRSTARVRDSLVQNPGLFFRSLNLQQEEQDAKILRKTADEAWIEDLNIIGHILYRLRKLVPVLFTGACDQAALWTAMDRTTRNFQHLYDEIAAHGYNGNASDNPYHAPERCSRSSDCQGSEILP